MKMSNDMIAILIYFIGWLLFSIGYYIYKMYIDRYRRHNKKLLIWRAFKNGCVSWLGIFVIVAFLIVGSILAIDEWIEKKLS